MSDGTDEEEIRRLMSILGRRKSKKKSEAARRNVKKAQAARRKKAKAKKSKKK
jgi:hypothetical protein